MKHYGKSRKTELSFRIHEHFFFIIVDKNVTCSNQLLRGITQMEEFDKKLKNKLN